jgi:hypothetical protein
VVSTAPDDPTADDPTSDDPTEPTGELPGTDNPGAVVGPIGVFGTGTIVVETAKLVVLRLVEFSEETVCTEVVKMVDVVKLWLDVRLAVLIELIVVLQGATGTPVPEVKMEVVLADLSELVAVALSELSELRVLTVLADLGEPRVPVVLQGT